MKSPFPTHVFREIDSSTILEEILPLVARIQVLQRSRQTYPVDFQFVNRDGEMVIVFTGDSFRADVNLTYPRRHDLQTIRLIGSIINEDEIKS